MSGAIAVPQDLGSYPPEARARVLTLQQDLDAALQAGDLLRARGLRLSLQVQAIFWLPDEMVA